MYIFSYLSGVNLVSLYFFKIFFPPLEIQFYLKYYLLFFLIFFLCLSLFFYIRHSSSKKSSYFLSSEYTMKIIQDFLDIKYVFRHFHKYTYIT